MTITEFLLARIAEDEAAVDQVIDDRRIMEHEVTRPETMLDASEAYCGVAIVRVGIDRVLAECAAKRAIVELCEQYRKVRRQAMDGWLSAGELATDPERALAAVYADHPDYDPAWRV